MKKKMQGKEQEQGQTPHRLPPNSEPREEHTGQGTNLGGGKAAVLFPLSGKARPDQEDLADLMNGREALEGIAQAILANKPLATMIAFAWLRERGYNLVPQSEDLSAEEALEKVKRVREWDRELKG